MTSIVCLGLLNDNIFKGCSPSFLCKKTFVLLLKKTCILLYKNTHSSVSKNNGHNGLGLHIKLLHTEELRYNEHQIIGQDEVWVFRVGLRSRMKMDSQIFLSGPSLHTCKILMETLLLSSCTPGWFVWWRPNGVSVLSFLFCASLICSLYLSLTERRVSPI